MRSNLLTASRLRTARKCKREHRIKYEQGYRPVVDAEELAFGSLCHKGLEAWWLAVARHQTALGLRFAIDAMRAEKAEAIDLVRAEVMLAGYDARWAIEAEHYETLGVELQFRTEVRNPKTGAVSRTWLLGGKLDVLLRDRRDGRIVFMEHKTSSEDIAYGSVYWRALRMDGQISVYFDGATSLGYGVEACIYDVLGKPALRLLKATPPESRKFKANGELYANQRAADETLDEYRARLTEAIAAEPERYYVRGEVVRLDAELDEARADVWALADELRVGHNEDRAPRNPDACRRFGHMCSFFDHCTGAASLDDRALYFVLDDVHPELAGATSSDSQQSPKEVGT